MHSNRLVLLTALAGALGLSACDKARTLEDSGGGGGACTACHGGTDNTSGAPPVDTSGNTASAVVGAHTAHVDAQVPCSACHGAAPGGSGHNDGAPAEIEFTGTAVIGVPTAPTYDFVTKTCSGVYCHGATLADGSGTAPIWTGGPLVCSSCHGYPPLSVSPHTPSTTNCATCHPAVPGADHVNGTVDVASAHPAGWSDPTVHGPAAIADLASCQSCHGTDYSGGVGPSCNACHETTGGWNASALTTNCTFCHGTKTRSGYDFATDPKYLAAPPEGVAGATVETDPHVGAHQAHLTGGTYSTPIACAQCHAEPADLSHVNGTVAFAWGSLATADGATPTFNATGQTCTNYCHGSTMTGGLHKNPSFTETDLGASVVERCAACHGSVDTAQTPDTLLAPDTGRHITRHSTVRCYRCHGSVVERSTVTPANSDPALVADRSLHLNGARDVQFRDSSGNILTTNTWDGTSCTTTCHGLTSRTW